jgi:hypothetical protein
MTVINSITFSVFMISPFENRRSYCLTDEGIRTKETFWLVGFLDSENVNFQKDISSWVANGRCVCSIACRELERWIEYKQHQGNRVGVSAFGSCYILLLNQRSVQRTTRKRLRTLLILIRGSAVMMAAWCSTSHLAAVTVIYRRSGFGDLRA